MIFTYSLISGFRAILGSVGTQASMALIMYLYVQSPKAPYMTEPNPGENESYAAQLETLRQFVFWTHVYCGVILVAP